MKTVIKLLMLYLGIQLVSYYALSLFWTLSDMLRGVESVDLQSQILAPSLLLSTLLMAACLWFFRYITPDKKCWSSVSPLYLGLTTVATLSCIWLLDALLSWVQLPDWMESSFDVLQGGWLGILSITIAGPILEEMLFRGVFTRVLLQRYRPILAILLSALIFGLIHINPVQVLGATLMGILLAWIYYRTSSLIPCILSHILNNSLSVSLHLTYPDAENLAQVMGGELLFYWLLTAFMGLLFVGTLWWMRRIPAVACP